MAARPIRRFGIIEAFQDFGVDTVGSEALEASLVAAPTIQVQDLALNFEPSLRAVVYTTGDFAAAGAGNFTGVSLQALHQGFWVTGLWAIQNFGHVWTATAPWTSGTTWQQNSVGSAPGETAFSGGVSNPYFAAQWINAAGQAVGPEGRALRFGTAQGNIFERPFWVPGNVWLNIVGLAANTAWTFAIRMQVPQTTPVKF